LLVALMILLLVLMAAAYVAVPLITQQVARHVLPVDLGDGWVAQRFLTAPVDADVAARFGTSRARALAGAASGHWVPPGILRDGETLVGSGAIDNEAGGLGTVLSWRIAVGGDDPPEVRIHLDTARADALLAPYAAVDGNGFRFAFVVAKAQLTPLALGDPNARLTTLRWTLSADGAIQFTFAGATTAVPAHLDAHLEANVRPCAGGFAPAVQVTIDHITTPEADLPLLTSPATCRQLQDLANAEISLQLQGVVLPTWMPTDVVVSAAVP
jgi:hypothetical protein